MPPTKAWRELRRTVQPVERVLVPDLRRKRTLRAFFNTLRAYPKFNFGEFTFHAVSIMENGRGRRLGAA
jgi:hypothetical protein